MASGDTEVATLDIKLATPTPPATPSAPTWAFQPGVTPIAVTFFTPPAPAKDILHVTAPGQPLATLGPNLWLTLQNWQLSSFFFWDAQFNIKWNTGPWEPADGLAKVTAFTTGSVVGSATTQAPSVPSQSASPTAGVTPSTTLPVPTAPSDVSTEASNSATSLIPEASTVPERVNKGISTGAIAGAAVGSFIAGAIVAGLVLWLCWGKRKRSIRVRDQEASSVALMPQEKGFHASATPLGAVGSKSSPTTDLLPLPLEDKAIIGEISKISNSIKNHVQSYYQMGRMSPGFVDLDDIHALGGGQPISAGTLSTLLGNSATREIALRFCIAWVVCSRMLPSKDWAASLLPVEIGKCYQAVANDSGNPSDQSSAKLARWRVTTAELLQGKYARNPFTRSDSQNENIQTAVVALDNILRPFADSRMENGDRKRNLEEILKRSALFAFTLFSQPSTWGFDWEEEGAVKSGDLTIFPCLLQLSDENGQSVVPPRPFSEAVVRRLTD
ncbi:hypothetical protein HBI81_153970 [Parastagonospora nodorum]|nr:hypothetical protein HBI80_082170 [Parastagonospora nodorum]KAH6521263.1 hypothetical protein HBI81_153970 [Parastagonospora nodorum]